MAFLLKNNVNRRPSDGLGDEGACADGGKRLCGVPGYDTMLGIVSSEISTGYRGFEWGDAGR